MPDVAAAEAARAVGYAGIGAVTLKVLEFLLKTFGVTKNLQATEMEQTLGAAAKMREELRKDNEDLRARMREMETRLEKLEEDYHTVRELNDKLRVENDDLKAQVRLHEARERGRIKGN
jgi:predicted nuclease with TOPRIM domain